MSALDLAILFAAFSITGLIVAVRAFGRAFATQRVERDRR